MSSTLEEQREMDAALCQAVGRQFPFSDKPWAVLALRVAAGAIMRGRLMTPREKRTQLEKALKDLANE